MSAAIVLALMLLAGVLAGCGGDDDDASSSSSNNSSDSTTGTADGASDTTGFGAGDDSADPADSGPAGPVNGPIISILSFDFGMFALDRETGEATAITVPDAGFSDRTQRAELAPDGSHAYVVVATPIEDQEFTNELALAEVDLATGEAAKLVELGRERENDEATERTDVELIGVGDSDVWIELDEPSGVSIVAYARNGGAETVRIPHEDDARVLFPVVSGDTLYGMINQVVSVWDGSAWQPMLDLDELNLVDIVGVENLDPYVTVDGGGPVPQQVLDFSFFGDISPSTFGWQVGGGSLFFLFNDITSLDDGRVIAGGMVEIDLASGELVTIYPLGPYAGEFVAENEYSGLSQGTYDFVDGQLWFADSRDDGQLFRFDQATGEVAAFVIPAPADVDFIRIEMLDTDPEGVWVEVSDWTIQTEEEGGGRTSSGVTRYERLDPETGESIVQVIEQDLF